MREPWFLFLGLVLFFPLFSRAAVMNSQNFKIGSDVIGIGGGTGNSASYKVNGTLGESVVGSGTGGTYKGSAGFWQADSQGLSLSCEASNVYMADYTLGDSNNYNKYLFSTSQECIVTDNTSAPWDLTIDSTNLTSAQNNVPDSNVYLSTDGNVGAGDTIASPTANLTEPAGPDYSLNSIRTIIQGNASASGTYNSRPTIKINQLNNLYNESLSGTLTITIQ